MEIIDIREFIVAIEPKSPITLIHDFLTMKDDGLHADDVAFLK